MTTRNTLLYSSVSDRILALVQQVLEWLMIFNGTDTLSLLKLWHWTVNHNKCFFSLYRYSQIIVAPSFSWKLGWNRKIGRHGFFLIDPSNILENPFEKYKPSISLVCWESNSVFREFEALRPQRPSLTLRILSKMKYWCAALLTQ